MKVKIFEKIVSVSGSDEGGNLVQIEDTINKWLKENSSIEIIDIRFSYGGAPVEGGPTNYGVMCLILYKEKSHKHRAR